MECFGWNGCLDVAAGLLVDEELLARLVRRARERWPDFEIRRIEQRKSKQVFYGYAQGYFFKLVVHSDGRIYVFSPATSVSLGLKRIARRVLRVE